MRGRPEILAILMLGGCLLVPASRARAFGYIEVKDPVNQAATNPALNIASTQPNYAAGPPFTLPSGSTAVLNDPFVVQQFDAAKYSTATQTAVLSEVVISLQYEFDNGIQMSFTKASTGTVSAQGSMHLDIGNAAGQIIATDVVGDPTTPGGTPGFSTSKTLTYNPNAAPNTLNTITTPNFSTALAPVSASTAANAYFDTAHLNMFSGNGQVLLPVYATATSSYTNATGNGGGGVITTASAALSVTYYYTLVPEPSSLVMMGLGTLGLGALQVRNRRKIGTSAA